MNYDLTTPCGNCPFRSDKVFYLRAGRMEEIIEGIRDQNATFACHKTTGIGAGDDDGEDYSRPTGKEQQCAGALILLAKNDDLYANGMFRLAARLGLLDVDKLNMDAPVYDDYDECIETTEILPSDRARKAR